MLPVNYLDYILFPFYIIIIYIIAFSYLRVIPKSIKRFYIPALTFKIVCAIVFVLIYRYIYGYGDTFGYFNDARLLFDLLTSKPTTALRILFGSYEQFVAQFPNHFISWNNNNYSVVQLIFPLVVFGFKSYLPTTLLLAFITFMGSWKLFEYFCRYFPMLKRPIAVVCLFLPSVVFWSSGILKDSICMASLCFLFVAIANMLIQKKIKIKYLVTMLICFFIILNIKSYILLAFFPAMALYISLEKTRDIKNRYLRKLFIPFLLVIGVGVGYYAINSLAGELVGESGSSAIESAIQSGVDLQEAINAQDGGSNYRIEMEPTLFGLISASPSAIVTTLFRPYPWEANNMLMIFTSIESFILLAFSIFIVCKLGLIKTFKYIFSSPLLIFLFTFSIIFALFVGFSTGNFGTLVRYKIPCIPFYSIALILLLSKTKRYKYVNSLDS